MTKRIAINGFGRIGRITLRRILSDAPDMEVVAINDLTEPKVLAHLFRFDSAFGQFDGTVEATENGIIVNDKFIKVYSERDAHNLPWGEENIDVVIESTGFYTSEAKSQAHIDAGAKKVIISGPAGPIKTIVFNVNDEILNADDRIISVASCTTNGLAPMAKALNDAFGLEVGTMTTVHAYTGNQAMVDGPKGDNLRGARAAAANIVPYTTGAAKAIGLVLPELNGKLQGHSHRVPVIDGSVVELVSILSTKVTDEMVNNVMVKATDNNPSFGYTDLEIVSSDIIGTPFGSIFDATQTEVTTVGDYQLVKTVAWYDNEFGFVTQLVRTLLKFAAL